MVSIGRPRSAMAARGLPSHVRRVGHPRQRVHAAADACDPRHPAPRCLAASLADSDGDGRRLACRGRDPVGEPRLSATCSVAARRSARRGGAARRRRPPRRDRAAGPPRHRRLHGTRRRGLRLRRSSPCRRHEHAPCARARDRRHRSARSAKTRGDARRSTRDPTGRPEAPCCGCSGRRTATAWRWRM